MPPQPSTIRGILSFTCGILIGTLAYASTSVLTPRWVQSNAEPGPDTTSWILIGTANKKAQKATKLSVGAQLHAPVATPQTITPALNPTLQSNGQIAGPGPFKDCACIWHYHGSLLGLTDPDSGHCGWGCAVPFDRAGNAAGFLSGATMLEARAAKTIDTIPPDFAAALQDVKDAREQLSGFVDAVEAEADARAIPEKVANNVERQAAHAAALDDDVQEDLNKLIDHTGGSPKRAVKNLLKAISMKQKAMLTLAKAQDLKSIH